MVNRGFESGIAQRSEKTRFAFALAGAKERKKDLVLNAVNGVAEARKLRDRVSSQMRSKGWNPEDALVYIVFVEPDFTRVSKRLIGIENGPSDMRVIQDYMGKLPIGFLIFIWDKDAETQPIFGHARPLIVSDPRSIRLNEQALASAEKDIRKQMGLTIN
jgi:hypothetical protein